MIVNDPEAVQLSVAVTPVVKFGTGARQLTLLILLAFPVWFEPHDEIVGAIPSTPAATVAVTVAVQRFASVTV